jgi:hypothetical protein
MGTYWVRLSERETIEKKIDGLSRYYGDAISLKRDVGFFSSSQANCEVYGKFKSNGELVIIVTGFLDPPLILSTEDIETEEMIIYNEGDPKKFKHRYVQQKQRTLEHKLRKRNLKGKDLEGARTNKLNYNSEERKLFESSVSKIVSKYLDHSISSGYVEPEP